MTDAKTSASIQTVVDIFAGVGGFSLGAVRAGFEVIAAIDLDARALCAHARNFPQSAHTRRDVRRLTEAQLRDIAKLKDATLTALIGGPPCQGFSTIGRMRKNDARNKLFYHFFRLISEVRPMFFVCENVPGILDAKYQRLREESLGLIENAYCALEPFSLSASECGAATQRRRVFFVGWRKESGIQLSQSDFIPKICRRITVETAFNGLPHDVEPDWRTGKTEWRRIKGTTEFARTINVIYDGVGDRDSLAKFLQSSEASGFLGTTHTSKVVSRFAGIRPGETDPVSRFPRLKWDALCPTLRAGTGNDRGSYQAARPIHPAQNRVITTREAARLQGFPDWYRFDSTKWHSFRQIGNSLSPLVAEHLMKVFARALRTSRQPSS